MKKINDYIENMSKAAVIFTKSKEPEGDRYYGYSTGEKITHYEFDDGVVLSVNEWHEPGDMFNSSDRGVIYSIENNAGFEFDTTRFGT